MKNKQIARGSEIDQSINKISVTNNEIESNISQSITGPVQISGPIQINQGLQSSEVFELIEYYVYSKKEELKILIKSCIDDIPSEMKISPNPRIFVPSIQKLSYSMENDDIKKMYTNLLKSSMHAQKANMVHPSFSSIIEQLTPDEAKLLKYIYNFNQKGPLIGISKKHPQGKGRIPIINMYTTIGTVCEFPINTVKYLENLARLKLINIDMDVFFTEDNLYLPLIKTQAKYFDENNTIKNEFSLKKGLYEITEFGKEFCDICMS